MECNNTAGYVRKRWIALTITSAPPPVVWSSSWHAREIVLKGVSATDFLKIAIRYVCKRYGIRACCDTSEQGRHLFIIGLLKYKVQTKVC